MSKNHVIAYILDKETNTVTMERRDGTTRAYRWTLRYDWLLMNARGFLSVAHNKPPYSVKIGGTMHYYGGDASHGDRWYHWLRITERATPAPLNAARIAHENERNEADDHRPARIRQEM